jgi:hypothetical protein
MGLTITEAVVRWFTYGKVLGCEQIENNVEELNITCNPGTKMPLHGKRIYTKRLPA